MSKIVRFVPKSERARTRLIREARAIYDSVFPPSDPAREQRNKAFASHMRSGADTDRGEGDLS
ncbi:hypothetical protein FXB41_23180 [Bradyrhizobium canariense]|uniref:hypothetical protein n=1 Tax=Bradyrhizobium canariense TaxID=255045 RepID=UPI001FE3CA69|nr:hypothetical protein [Bradyrhizobium canariense]MBW5437552.1 hypothetical protein [Bradyrhizobium canariense]